MSFLRVSSILFLMLLALQITGEEFAPEYRAFADYNNEDDVWEYQRFQHYGFKTPGPERRSIDGLLAFLAPIAAIPIITGATLTGLAAILPVMTSQNRPITMGRRKRDVEHILFLTLTQAANRTVKRDARRNFQDLDVIQKYLRQVKPHDDYNEEVLATYLGCSGMLDSNNHCLEKLVCQFSDNTSSMSQLEKDVSSLIIYTILNNRFISDDFKNRMKKAALTGRDHPGKCRRYYCTRTSYNGQRYYKLT
ncbi:uncharacterized protein [Centruroides vittatus]|uniref:uncharacterized protein n=1 Tax=Centruroides vittatus TaxID=120091 RepID=UPI00350EA147